VQDEPAHWLSCEVFVTHLADVVSVAMIARDYPPAIGGIPTHTHGLVSHLRKLNRRVDVYATRTDLGTLLVPLRSSFRSRMYDIVHVQSAPYGALVRKHPFVITVHSPLVEEAGYYGVRRQLKTPFAFLLELESLRRADALVAVSKATMRILVSRYRIPEERVRLIRNGVDCDSFFPAAEKDPSTVLICSRLDKRKNIAESFSALSALKNHRYKVIVVGEGPERERLERLAGSSVPQAIFAGGVPQEELYGIFASSGIFVSTSWSEGFGLSVLQAMSSGCAVIVSDIPSHRDLVTHMEDGMIYSNTQELAEFIASLLSDPATGRRMGRKARERALEYSWENVARETAKLYDELLSHGSIGGRGRR
jgi:glycosyltransferase involved in cell wall biosynthesis